MGATNGRIPEDLILSLSASEKESFLSVRNRMGLEILMWSGRVAPKSLERNEWISFVSSLIVLCKSEMISERIVCSVDEGYPRSN